jgi:hypothetical protein
MKTSRKLLGTILTASCLAFIGYAISAPSPNPDITGKTLSGKPIKKADLLFVQNAKSVSFGEGTMTLHDVAPLTIAFSDRPERFSGQMPTSEFVPMWSEGKDSFIKDPPNATVSVLGSDMVSSLVVVLRNPRMKGSDLLYDVQVLEGAPPAHDGEASLFIDIIGMPLTPLSYAGVARRSFARGAYYAGGYHGPCVAHYGSYDGSSGYMSGFRGSASWSNGSGSATGWRGNTVSWNRR